MTAPLDVAILGAGVSGLCMGIQLQRAGITSFAIFEKSNDVGGTWLDNSYPGSGCDVPSHLYSFSFEPNPEWSRAFSPQPEIQRYLRHCAEKYGLLAEDPLRHRDRGRELRRRRRPLADPHRRRRGDHRDARWSRGSASSIARTSPDLPGLAAFRGHDASTRRAGTTRTTSPASASR